MLAVSYVQNTDILQITQVIFWATCCALCIVRARDCQRNLSDRAQRKETKGFCTGTTREHLLAFVYKRSFSSDV